MNYWSVTAGGSVGSIACALMGHALWPHAPGEFICGAVFAAFLLGAALGRVAWGRF